MKEGVLTSEFWLTIVGKVSNLVIVIGAMILLGTSMVSVEELVILVPVLVAAIAGISIGSSSYSASRGLAKFNGKKPEVK